MDEMGKLQTEIDAANGWDLDSQLEQAMDALQCPDQRDVVENHAVSVSLTGVDHLIDKLSQSWFRSLLDCFLHGSGHTCIAHYSKRGLQIGRESGQT